MKFNFKIQQYQTDAVENTVNVFTGQPFRDLASYRHDLGRNIQLAIDEDAGYRNADVELSDSDLFCILATGCA